MSDEDKDVVEKVLDLFVYAPLGLALNVRQMLPELAEKGRQQVTGQVTMARMIGQFAVQQGTTEAEKAFERARTSAQSTLEQLGVLGSEAPAPSTPRPAPAARPAATPPTEAEAPAPAPSPPGPSVETLAIPDYDSLSASQVVPRLAGLSIGELEAVRAYEAGHRARKTILNRVTQLQ